MIEMNKPKINYTICTAWLQGKFYICPLTNVCENINNGFIKTLKINQNKHCCIIVLSRSRKSDKGEGKCSVVIWGGGGGGRDGNQPFFDCSFGCYIVLNVFPLCSFKGLGHEI
jgi:hypothetical protein